MLLSLLLGILVTLIVFPTAPVAQTLHRFLVEPVARRLSRVRFGHVLFAAALSAIGAVLFMGMAGEGLKLFSLFAPEAVSWFAMFDAALFLDVFAMAVAIAATTRLRSVGDQIVTRVRSALTRPRSSANGGRQRARRDKSTTARPKRSDDPDPFGAGYAFG